MSDPDPTPEEIIRREERGFVAALRFMTQQAEKRWPTMHDALEVHRLLFGEANAGMAGQYRLGTFYPAYIRFPVPDWKDVPACLVQPDKLYQQAKEMYDRLEGEERDVQLIEWVARLHHRFERIHPFQDGNGRSGRIIATWMLLHYDLPPFEFGTDRRDSYLDALAAADVEVSADDLKFADFYPRQTRALRPLIDFFLDALLAFSEEESTEGGLPASLEGQNSRLLDL